MLTFSCIIYGHLCVTETEQQGWICGGTRVTAAKSTAVFPAPHQPLLTLHDILHVTCVTSFVLS